MGKRAFGIIVLLAFFGSAAMAQDARNIVDVLARTIGAANVKTIQFSGSGYIFGFGQSYQPGGPWVKFNLKSYTQLADYERGASRE